VSRVDLAPASDADRATDRRPLVTLLTPAYNEADLVAAHLRRLCDYMDSLAGEYRYELLVIDDGSKDGTGNAARAFAATRPNVRVHSHPVNLGLGQALRTGFPLAQGEVIVVLDLDLTYSPEHIRLLLERIRETHADIVLASPYMQGGRATAVPWFRRSLSRWGNRFLALTARGANPEGNLTTLTGMVRAYDARFIQSLSLKSTGPEINTEIVYKAMILHARVVEVPAHLDWSARRHTPTVSSSARRIRRGIVLSLLAGFIIRPFAFFIFPALFLSLTSVYMVAWISYNTFVHYRSLAAGGGGFDYLLSAAIGRAFADSPHAFIVAGITILLSVQLFSLGVLALQAKEYFEELFHFATRVHADARERDRRSDPGRT